jgi:hypothetical protein
MVFKGNMPFAALLVGGIGVPCPRIGTSLSIAT